MATASLEDWIHEFGLGDRTPPHFFSSLEELENVTGTVPQPHALRRAFEQLGIEGVLCQDRSPVIYFRQVDQIDPVEIANLHHSFWNQGIAPILVIIAKDEVHVYSGLIPPADALTESGQPLALVETLNRVQDQLRSFLLSVESGEYFHIHRRSFDPNKRVDRALLRNLQATRQELGRVHATRLEPYTLDAILCRLVFTCYLFDRGIIDRDYLEALDINDAEHLRDILAKQPRLDARTDLYKLFGQLGVDFNGDLFTIDLSVESQHVWDEHIAILASFFHGTDVQTGQRSFWPYDFSFIPIETISSIYEHFLKVAGEKQKKEDGAFYTPRFLAEFVLDMALEGETSLLNKRFLDPACGSGIFLVGLFNRLAEEWKLKYSDEASDYTRRANGLIDVLCTMLYGCDSNRSACQIAAFSLYLALMDQLSPPGIRQFFGKVGKLPYLISDPGTVSSHSSGHTIYCADFFTESIELPHNVHVIVGNPPWGPVKNNAPVTVAEKWCSSRERKLAHPNREKSIPFVWKAPTHLEDGGKICFVLPHGILFNHNDTAIRFQQSFFRVHAVDRVVNLTDYQFFLFEESQAPALVIRYRKEAAPDSTHLIDYWVPKTDWAVVQAEIIGVLPQDRSRVTVHEVLDDLMGDDAPQIWKQRSWATPRDWRLLDRLALMSRLRDIVGQPGRGREKRWLIAEGFQPLGANDDPVKAQTLSLSSRLFVEATAKELSLFLNEDDCRVLPSQQVTVRSRSNKNTEIFKAPHVLVTKGVAREASRVAYADFDVSFRHALRGIHGPRTDRNLLIFLAAYLRSNLARFFLFHTSSNWGVSRAEIHVEELLRLPFPLPNDTHNPVRCQAIVDEVAFAVMNAAKEASGILVDRKAVVRQTQTLIEKLVEEYFDIDNVEQLLIADTAKFIIPSVRPSRSKPSVPTLEPSNRSLRDSYAALLCDRLNGWAKHQYMIQPTTVVNAFIGVGVVVLERTKRDQKPVHISPTDDELLRVVYDLQQTTIKNYGTFEIVRGLKVFHNNLLYITKPLGQRFWTNTAALNDADEIATTILARTGRQAK